MYKFKNLKNNCQKSNRFGNFFGSNLQPKIEIKICPGIRKILHAIKNLNFGG